MSYTLEEVVPSENKVIVTYVTVCDDGKVLAIQVSYPCVDGQVVK